MFLISLATLIGWRVAISRNDADEVVSAKGHHYAFILTDEDDLFWSSVYEGACSEAEERNIYLENTGDTIGSGYDKYELMDVAGLSGVDGIIVKGEQSEKLDELIDAANEEGIPVVTGVTDCYGSDRCAFVGISDYDLGREYARQVIKAANSDMSRLVVLYDSKAGNGDYNLIYNGLTETLANEGNHLNLECETVYVDATGAFTLQETLQELLNEDELADVMICMSEELTEELYQCLVDRNKIGDVRVIGFYYSDLILKAIDKGAIFSTVTYDARELGKVSVRTLDEYLTEGFVNDYYTLDAKVINSTNVGEYLE